jgi:hypothetical protein
MFRVRAQLISFHATTLSYPILRLQGEGFPPSPRETLRQGFLVDNSEVKGLSWSDIRGPILRVERLPGRAPIEHIFSRTSRPREYNQQFLQGFEIDFGAGIKLVAADVLLQTV